MNRRDGGGRHEEREDAETAREVKAGDIQIRSVHVGVWPASKPAALVDEKLKGYAIMSYLLEDFIDRDVVALQIVSR